MICDLEAEETSGRGPDCAKQTQFLNCELQTNLPLRLPCGLPPLLHGGRNAQNEPNLPPRRLGPGRAMAPNKANSGGSRIEAKPFSGKELCRMYLCLQLGEKKPIPAAMPIRRSAFPGGQTCNIASMPRFGKRSQFGRASGDRIPPSRAPRGRCTNKPNLGRWDPAPRRELLSCKTKPIPAEGLGS